MGTAPPTHPSLGFSDFEHQAELLRWKAPPLSTVLLSLPPPALSGADVSHDQAVLGTQSLCQPWPDCPRSMWQRLGQVRGAEAMAVLTLPFLPPAERAEEEGPRTSRVRSQTGSCGSAEGGAAQGQGTPRGRAGCDAPRVCRVNSCPLIGMTKAPSAGWGG